MDISSFSLISVALAYTSLKVFHLIYMYMQKWCQKGTVLKGFIFKPFKRAPFQIVLHFATYDATAF